MSGNDSIVAETAARIFADLGDPQTVNGARDDAWRAPLWQALSDNGLTLAWVPEANGGAGGEPADLAQFDLRSAREKAERTVVVSALAHADGNVVKASELLGVSRPTLYDLMNRLQIRNDR